MKATLEYTLPEESGAFDDAVNGESWKFVVLSLDRQLRDWLKHGTLCTSVEAMLEETRKRLREEAADYNLRIE